MFNKLLGWVTGTQQAPSGVLPPVIGADDDLALAERTLEAIADPETIKREAALQVRARVSSILACAEAQGRNRQACYLALETDLSLDAVQAILAAGDREVTGDAAREPSRKEIAASQSTDFFSRHRAENPELWSPPSSLNVSETIARINGNYATATGRDLPK